MTLTRSAANSGRQRAAKKLEAKLVNPKRLLSADEKWQSVKMSSPLPGFLGQCWSLVAPIATAKKKRTKHSGLRNTYTKAPQKQVGLKNAPAAFTAAAAAEEMATVDRR